MKYPFYSKLKQILHFTVNWLIFTDFLQFYSKLFLHFTNYSELNVLITHYRNTSWLYALIQATAHCGRIALAEFCVIAARKKHDLQVANGSSLPLIKISHMRGLFAPDTTCQLHCYLAHHWSVKFKNLNISAKVSTLMSSINMSLFHWAARAKLGLPARLPITHLNNTNTYSTKCYSIKWTQAAQAVKNQLVIYILTVVKDHFLENLVYLLFKKYSCIWFKLLIM